MSHLDQGFYIPAIILITPSSNKSTFGQSCASLIPADLSVLDQQFSSRMRPD